MTEEIIVLRPHHIDRFVDYYHGFRNLFDNPIDLQQRYGKDFARTVEDFIDFLASGGTGGEYILIKNGLDEICRTCPRKRETCSEPDSLSLWNGSGQVMQEMNLKEGWVYPLNEFVERVEKLYPNRNPSRR